MAASVEESIILFCPGNAEWKAMSEVHVALTEKIRHDAAIRHALGWFSEEILAVRWQFVVQENGECVRIVASVSERVPEIKKPRRTLKPRQTLAQSERRNWFENCSDTDGGQEYSPRRP